MLFGCCGLETKDLRHTSKHKIIKRAKLTTVIASKLIVSTGVVAGSILCSILDVQDAVTAPLKLQIEFSGVKFSMLRAIKLETHDNGACYRSVCANC